MVFSSIIFLCVFLPIMIVGYYLLPGKLKNIYLLLGSLFFYAWGEAEYTFIMVASIVGNYVFGMLIHYLEQKGRQPLKKAALVVTVLYNLGWLFYFKYFMFLAETIEGIVHANLSIPEIVLPIGISFYTFQGMSYVIDVYREDGKTGPDGQVMELVQKNPINLALYISMFPQLIAGPIVRYQDIRNSLVKRSVSLQRFALGAERFAIGLGKKVLLSNGLGEVSNKIMTSDFSMLGTPSAWAGAICYMLHIYYDFSGYSDMAIGLGKIFGFDFLENFNYPYISKSITEFWRRWHISLSSWFRDYLYIPLGGNRRGNVYVNLFIVFLATGIWHGADWGFLIWGLWHGAFILAERVGRNKGVRMKLPAFVKWLYTMLVVLFGWVLFSIVKVPDTLEYISVMFHLKKQEFIAYSVWYYLDAKVLFLLAAAVLAALPWKEILGKYSVYQRITANELSVKAGKRLILIGMMVLCFIFMVNDTYNPFIYFRF